ncbi:lipoprotein [Candidatus Scalindua japonica]|uniref:Lipoprotein n=1 Tax=Candidatus Scalindua japonica TaxID=1284222 RepID=A0A286TUR7_9BACT|nr:outer membrane protein assembly factor BamD [Candidatus Scalindua japonica]GAX59591.1 lipoprotein [Candidatus Scalindua japonica]
MKKQLIVLFILAGFLFTGTKSSSAEWVWSGETSWVDPDKLTRETNDQQYKYAIALMIKREYISAIGVFKSVIKENPDTELAVESQLNIGKSYFLAGDYKSSFRAYERLIEKDPATRRLQEILDREFNVGVAQMERDEYGAIKVFERIIERNPLGFIAADSQVKIGECYYQLREFDQAEDSFLSVMENYPDSEWVPYAQFRIPYCKLSNIRAQERNYDLLTKSRNGFEVYLANNPQGALVNDTHEIIKEIDTKLAEREYETGTFYLRQKRPAAGLIYFKSVIKNYPESEWAALAEEKIKMLKNVGAIR